MQHNGSIARFHKLFLAAIPAFLLIACGSGGGSGGGGGASLGGTAATGAPLDGIVYVTDANGTEVNIPANADGSFSVSVAGMTPPFMLRAIPNDEGDVLYSFASETGITVNITPLTSLALYLVHKNNLADLYDDWSEASNALDDVMITEGQEAINASLASLFNYYGVNPAHYDFVNTPFNADHRGIDRVLDNLFVMIDPEENYYTVEVDGDEFEIEFYSDSGDYEYEYYNEEEDEYYSVNIGEFSVDPYSTWELTISDPAFESDSSLDHKITVALVPVIENDGLYVSGMEVPNDRDEFKNTSTANRYFIGKILHSINSYFYQGVEIGFDNVSVTFDVYGNGEIGTLVSGTITGTANVTGTFEGEAVNETVNLNTVFTWELLDDRYGEGYGYN